MDTTTTPKTADPALRHADTDNELRACFAVMQQLRPHLQDETDFMQRMARMRAQGYRLLAAWRADEPVALAGYRYEENLVHGRFLYVDDLIVTASLRGGQWGAKLLDRLQDLARDAGCARLVLDTGLSNALAQRFYFRQGLLTGAMRFSKSVVRE